MKKTKRQMQGGYAALTMTLVVIFASLAVIGGLTFFSLQEVGVNRAYTTSVAAHYIAEGGTEDALYRVLAGKQIASTQKLAVGDGTTTISVTTDPDGSRVVRSQGEAGVIQQNTETRVGITSDAVNFFYGVQVDEGGVNMGNGAKVIGNIFSNGSLTGGEVTGSAVVASGLALSPAAEWPVGCVSACGDADNAFATTTSNQDIAQSFIATDSGPLNKFSVFLGKNGSPSADITVRITSDVSGHPASSQLGGSATIVRTSVGNTPSWIDATFASPPTLVNGTKYWIVLDYATNSVINYWNWRKDSTDGYAGNTGMKTTSWSSGPWVAVGGDLAFRVWIGGANTQIANATVGTSARAPEFVNANVGGSNCPNVNCVVASDPLQPLPISDGAIQDFRDAAAAGGTVADQNISGTVSLGPKKINGNLTVNNGATLIVTGTLWVTGQFQPSNNATIKLSPGYGANSGVIVGDNTVDFSNNVTVLGSGSAGSYILVVAGKNAPSSQVMDISNNVAGAIFYAPHGRIHFNNNAGAKEVAGYGFDMDNNATVTYESGLQNVHFTSGPSAGYDVKYWKEVQ